MKNNLFLSFVVAVIAVIFTSCNGEGFTPFEESQYIKGDRTEVVEKEKIVYVTVIETEYKDHNFTCYDFSVLRNLILHIDCPSSNQFNLDYNLRIETAEQVYFSKQETAGETSFELLSNEADFEKNMSSFKVKKGDEVKTIDILVPGSSSVFINEKEIFPCKPFKITAKCGETKQELVNGIDFEVAEVTYTFYNGEGKPVTTAVQKLYAPLNIEKEDTTTIIYIEKDYNFTCYDFSKDGNIIAHVDCPSGETFDVSYNFTMTTAEEVRFAEQDENSVFSVTPNEAGFEEDKANFEVKIGNASTSVEINVPGANSITINGKDIYPCKPFKVKANVSTTTVETINGEDCFVAVATYTFFNGKGEEVKSVNQNLYAPIKKKVNERTITITHRVENKELVIEGNIDNTLWADTTAIVKVPLLLTLNCEAKKIVEANNFNGFSYDSPEEVSKSIAEKDLTASANGISVTYNKYENTYSQNVTASGNKLEVKQKVGYYNDFVVDFYGEKYDVSLPLEFDVVNSTSGEQTVVGDDIHLLHTINYQATIASLNATSSQEIEVVVNMRHFNERTVTIKDYKVENNKLVIEGNIDNTLLADTTVIVKVPLTLAVTCEAKKIVYANNFNGFSYDSPKEVSKTIAQKGLVYSEGGLSVTYNKYENTYSQNVTASGNNVEIKQKVSYYNNFDVEFFGKKRTFVLPLNFVEVNSTSGKQTVVGDDVRLLHTINYKASTESIDAVGSQDIEVVVNKSHLNEQTVTITHRFENNYLVIEGNVDNTMFEDINAIVRIPLKLTLNCENKKTVYSNSLNGFTYNPIHEASKVASQSGLTASSDGISVTYNEYESVYSHNVTASGNNVEVKQTLRYYNEFVAEFYGKEYPISLPLSFIVVNSTTGNQKVVDGKVSRSHFINYQASITSLNVTDSQEIEVIVNALSFDGQRVEEAYRTLTFKDHNTPLVYDCVLARSTNGSDHYFHYREIVNDKPQAWVSTKLTTSEYNAILAGKAKAADKGNKFALTIYYHKNHGMRLGYLIDGCPTEVIYYALTEGLPSVTLMGSRFVFLGDLNTAIAGSWVKEGDLIKLDNTSDIIYNNTVIARGSDVYFY